MTRIPAVTLETAPERSQSLLTNAQKALGKLPNILLSLGQSPAGLAFYLAGSQSLKTGQLSAKVREQIALTVAGKNGCEYCAAAHSFVGKLSGLSNDELTQNLMGHSRDDRTAVILKFVQDVMDTRGHVSDASLAALKAHEVDHDQTIEIVAHIALNIFTNYFNHIAKTAIDFPKVALPNHSN